MGRLNVEVDFVKEESLRGSALGLMITQIHIKNFRSTRDLLFNPGNLSILVGKNDSGKSNILRALNLFFNGETEQDEGVDFDFDHNIFNQPNDKTRKDTHELEYFLRVPRVIADS